MLLEYTAISLVNKIYYYDFIQCLKLKTFTCTRIDIQEHVDSWMTAER